ncbi:hypothetical protein TNCT_266211 [Trichonephila clavata]|uniref:Uncharacterized protein n=1 Tax=Trichonephila clavata TaxID=2740835 RepID=A0A8X6FG65_TRICU|nr:hypothetical protein TNCT_266211 [Trichonephila clavata]
MTVGEPVPDVFGSVLRILIQLENETQLYGVHSNLDYVYLRTPGVLQDVLTLKLIHDSLNRSQRDSCPR